MMKEIYPSVRVESLAIKKRPFLEWCPKADEFYGDVYVIPVLREDPQGRSAGLSTAITNAETSKQSKFVLTTRKKDYGVVKIEAEAIMAASKDVGSFIRAKDTQISGMLRQLGKSLHLALYRTVSGSIGRIAVNGIDATGTILTLSQKSDVYNFGEGQTLVANNTDDATSLKTGGVKVTKLNRGAGTITVSTDVTALGSAWAEADLGDGAADFLFNEGDPDARLAGLASWIPLAAPSATAFFGVDRTTDIEGLSGHRLDRTGTSILQNGEELAMMVGEYGGEPDAWFMNPRAGLQLAEEVGAKVERHDCGKAKVGFTGFTLVNFITGPLDVIFDIACPPNRAYILQRDTWKFVHMGGVPHIVRDDGKDSQRGATTDDIEVRGRYFGELACFSPGRNGVMSVATA